MAIRTSLLNGNVINKDADFSKYIETVSEPGVIEGLQVSSSSVAIGKARVPCERSNGDTIYALVDINAAVSISGDGDVYIKVDSNLINNGELANEDGTEIATIEVGTMPESNALLLATITSGEVEDKRNMIKKVGELNTSIGGLDTRLTAAEGEIQELEEAAAPSCLQQSGIVGEDYTLNDKLYYQESPVYANCRTDCNIGDVEGNTQIHIQRIGSKTASNQLKLKVKCVGEPTKNLIVEVRTGTKVNEETGAYWYGNELIASGSIAYSDITTSYQELTVTLNANFGGTRGALLDVVLYQEDSTVNSSNYYVVACDNSQYGEAFSYVSVNGTTRVRSKLMPYCISTGFEGALLSKIGVLGGGEISHTEIEASKSSNTNVRASSAVSTGGKYALKFNAYISDDSSGRYYDLYIYKNNQTSTAIGEHISVNSTTPKEYVWEDIELKAGDTITIRGKYTNNTTLHITSIEFGMKSNGNFTTLVYQQSELTKNTEYSYTCNAGKIAFEYTSVCGDSSRGTKFYIYKNGEEIYYKADSKIATITYNLSFDVGKGDVISWKWDSASSGAGSYAQNVYINYLGEPIWLTPTETKAIGGFTSAVSFGTVNGEFKGGQFVGETTEVLTGEIVLGNAVGFLTVNYKGSLLKIPYYG